MRIWIASVAFTLAALPAKAQDITIGAGLTSFGPVIEGSYAINDRFDARAQIIGGLSYSDADTVDLAGESYLIDGTATLGGLALLGDFYPTASGWRVSGGLFVSNTDLVATFTGPETFDGEVVFTNEIAPMIATGYKYDFTENWSLSGDLGLIISGIEVKTGSTDPDVVAEVASINDDLSDLPVLPYLSLTVGYRW